MYLDRVYFNDAQDFDADLCHIVADVVEAQGLERRRTVQVTGRIGSHLDGLGDSVLDRETREAQPLYPRRCKVSVRGEAILRGTSPTFERFKSARPVFLAYETSLRLHVNCRWHSR